jgi:hypothetical protein
MLAGADGPAPGAAAFEAAGPLAQAVARARTTATVPRTGKRRVTIVDTSRPSGEIGSASLPQAGEIATKRLLTFYSANNCPFRGDRENPR